MPETNTLVATLKEWKEALHIGELLRDMGEDLEREGLLDTPKRVQRAWREFLEGYTMSPEEILEQTFDAEGGGLQICRNIVFTSLCEHHLLAFHGTVQIAYWPNKHVCGLSKLARLVDCFGRRLQIQERMTQQICDALAEYLDPKGVYVTITARHLCCMGRGIRRDEMLFSTTAQYGIVKHMQLQTLLSTNLKES